MTDDGLAVYERDALTELGQAIDEEALERWYRTHLAPSGKANALKRSIGTRPKEERRAFGQAINQVVKALTARFEQQRAHVRTLAMERQLAERIDVSLPPHSRRQGNLHPLARSVREVCQVFSSMGFTVFESRHVETDWYNFGALNMPPHHPARDMQDTFYAGSDTLLRTHTSAGQIRAMQSLGPGPLRVVLPGLCYRNEDVTARSEMQFHQIEGLLVGPKVRMSDLKGVLLAFAKAMFGRDQRLRLRGSYFPFTEPSVEADIRCTLCSDGCRVCKYTGWLELLGAGMVHPVVLDNGGYDAAHNRGIAFGMGIERIVMLRHGIDDIRHFFRNDTRFLSGF